MDAWKATKKERRALLQLKKKGSQVSRLYRFNRAKKCLEMEDKKASKKCMNAVDEFQVSILTYATMEAKNAMHRNCEIITSFFDGCKELCDLTHRLYQEPNIAECPVIKEEWRYECDRRAEGTWIWSSATILSLATVTAEILLLF